MRRYLPLVFGVVVGMVCVRLGVWQLDRLSERKAMNVRGESRLAMEVVDLDEHPTEDSLDGRRASATGVFDFERQIVVMLRGLRGVPGVHIVTPLRLEDGTAVLVERGWAPSPDGKTVELAKFAEPAESQVVGTLARTSMPAAVSSGTTWPLYVRRPNASEIESRFPYPLRSMTLRRTVPPAAAPAELIPLPHPDFTNGSHLSYAIQWFSFATIAVVGSAILVWSRGRHPTVRGSGVDERRLDTS